MSGDAISIRASGGSSDAATSTAKGQQHGIDLVSPNAGTINLDVAATATARSG